MRRPTYSLAWTIFTATNLWAKKSGWSFGTGSSGSGGRSRRLRRRWTPTSPGSKGWTANGVYGCDLTYSGTEDDRSQGKSRIVQGKRSLFRELPSKSSSRKPKSKWAQEEAGGPAGSNSFLFCSIL